MLRYMPKITPSDLAPDTEVFYGLGQSDGFSLAPGEEYATDAPDVVANALAHPWLEVEADPLPVQPDAPVEVVEVKPVAIDAGLDQGESVVEDGVAQTLPAADEAEVVVPDEPTPIEQFAALNTTTEEEQD